MKVEVFTLEDHYKFMLRIQNARAYSVDSWLINSFKKLLPSEDIASVYAKALLGNTEYFKNFFETHKIRVLKMDVSKLITEYQEQFLIFKDDKLEFVQFF